ncbi:SDR family NAD(P)-dependent oxidoreductase [Candidatus Mcinerneyibacteriota bacterium]|nr:SDR family NAD(P)-dependent oxidoreductase [Candidatus Mcinerneyibacteriota bacterium]
MKHVIITGASRGVGRALVHSLAYGNFVLHCIARTRLDDLAEEIEEKVGGIVTYPYDLSRLEGLPGLMETIFSHIEEPEFVGLINNAAVLSPVGPLGKIESEKIGNAVNVNLSAPLILMNEFVRQSQILDCEKRILNISSGAGKHPYYGWSSYCSSKAGLDMASRVFAEEQKERKEAERVKILSLSPGIVDTDMQQHIRKQPRENFIYVGKFIEFHKSGALKKPEEVAEKIKEILFLDFFPDGEILDIREL